MSILGSFNSLSARGVGWGAQLQSSVTKIIDPNGQMNSLFGFDVSITPDGNKMVIINYNVTNGFLGYVYERVGGVWTLLQELAIPSRTVAYSCLISDDGNNVVITTISPLPAQVSIFTWNGASYVISQTLTTNLVPTWGLNANSIKANSSFTSLFFGIPSYNNYQGCVQQWDYNGTTWSFTSQGNGPVLQQNQKYGQALSYSNTISTLMIGMPQGAAGQTGQGNGRAYIGSSMITASDGYIGHGFGYDVALSEDGTTSVVNSQNGFYIYRKPATTWVQQQKITPSLLSGCAISANGSRVILGTGNTAGAQQRILVYDYNGAIFTLTNTFLPTLVTTSSSLSDKIVSSHDGKTFASGAPADNIGANTAQGSVLVYTQP